MAQNDIPQNPVSSSIPAAAPVAQPQTPSTQPQFVSPTPNTPVGSGDKKKKGKKIKLNGKIVAGIVSVLIAVGGIGAGVLLTQQQQDIREGAQEATVTPSPVGLVETTVTAVIPAFPDERCPWGTGINNVKGGDQARAFVKRDAPFEVCGEITGGTITATTTEEYLINDWPIFLFDGKIFGHYDQFLSDTGVKLGDAWDWFDILDTEYKSDNQDFVCLGTTCLAEPQYDTPNTDTSISGEVNIAFTGQQIAPLLSNSDSHEFSLVVIGDDESGTDCQLKEDLTLTLTMMCPATNSPTPTPTQSPSPTPTPGTGGSPTPSTSASPTPTPTPGTGGSPTPAPTDSPEDTVTMCTGIDIVLAATASPTPTPGTGGSTPTPTPRPTATPTSAPTSAPTAAPTATPTAPPTPESGVALPTIMLGMITLSGLTTAVIVMKKAF